MINYTQLKVLLKLLNIENFDLKDVINDFRYVINIFTGKILQFKNIYIAKTAFLFRYYILLTLYSIELF